MALFFLALVFAAWTSLVSMIELAARVLMDLGMTRGRAIAMVGTAGVLFGIPSALKLSIFRNQDWVWGVGLMVSGLFFAFAVLRYGVTRWRETFINTRTRTCASARGGTGRCASSWWRPWCSSGGGCGQAQGTSAAGRPGPSSASYNVGTVLIQWARGAGGAPPANRWLALGGCRHTDPDAGPGRRAAD